jgi:hypothetical protein
MASIFDHPTQTRNKKGQFNKKTSPPKPSTRLKKARVSSVKRTALYPLRGFVGEGQPKAPTRPMGVREKQSWFAQEKAKSTQRTKLRTRMAKRRSRNAKKILGKAWHRVW